MDGGVESFASVCVRACAADGRGGGTLMMHVVGSHENFALIVHGDQPLTAVFSHRAK